LNSAGGIDLNIKISGKDRALLSYSFPVKY
jgi:hypothetical protein